ncbi:MAG: acyl carrier protein [Lachnospiraceae bacterium]|nr:acyl carrier protein [Lachnospiraceae bacterium]
MEFDLLKDAIVDVLKVYPGEINENTTFLGDLGADSLDVYQIVIYVEDELNISLDVEDIKKISTVGEAVELIRKAEGKNGNK